MAVGTKNILGNLHQEDSYYQTAWAIDAKIGVMVVDDMAFHGMSLLGEHPTNVRVRMCQQQKEEGK